MISNDDKILECSVHINSCEKSSIRKLEDGKFDWRGIDIPGGECVLVEIKLFDKVIATSNKYDELPNIGLDFLWEFCKKPVESVRVHFTKDGNVKIHNESIVLSPIEKLYTEMDIYNILEYALGSFDKDKIKEIILKYRKK